MNPPLTPNIESCPVDERRMLSDGKTLAIPYPKAGYNCNPFGLSMGGHQDGGWTRLEHKHLGPDGVQKPF